MNEETAKRNGKKALPFIITAVAVLIALAVGIGIYNTPANRVKRQLDLGNKYLEEQRYEQAALAFEQVIEIDDRCMEAYAGGIEAYLGAGNADGAKDFYERTLAMLSGLDAEFLAENMDYAVELYLAADEVYGEDLERVMECLMEGYRITAGNEQIKELLIEICIRRAEELVSAEEFEEALAVLQEGYEETSDGRLKDKIEEVQEQYRQYLEWKAYMELVETILVRIAASCQWEAYDEVFTLMQSEEYAGFLERVGEIEETVGFDTQYGRIGLYKVDSEYFGNYMIYYGEYDEDLRQGDGVWLGYYDGNNYLAAGNWAGDKPQGEFHVREWSTVLAEDVVYRVISGNVEGGLWNGDVIWSFEETGGITISFPVSFENGKWVILDYGEDGDAIVCLSGTDGGSMSAERGRENDTLGIIGFAPDY